MKADAPGRVLVAGTGSVLLGDEGLGVHVARMLRVDPPAHADVLEAGTMLLDALPTMKRYPCVIIVDAIRRGHAPGTIHRLDLGAAIEEPDQADEAVSLHEWGVMATLRAGRRLGLLPPNVLLVGAEPEVIETGLDLSPRLAEAAERICGLLREAYGSHSK